MLKRITWQEYSSIDDMADVEKIRRSCGELEPTVGNTDGCGFRYVSHVVVLHDYGLQVYAALAPCGRRGQFLPVASSDAHEYSLSAAFFVDSAMLCRMPLPFVSLLLPSAGGGGV